MHLGAEDKDTGAREQVTITAMNGRLSEQDISRMVQEAEEYAVEDDTARDRLQARNGLEGLAYNMRNKVI